MSNETYEYKFDENYSKKNNNKSKTKVKKRIRRDGDK